MEAEKMDQQQQEQEEQLETKAGEKRWDGDNIYYCYYRFNQIESKKVQIKITELEEESFCKTEEMIVGDGGPVADKMEIPIQFEKTAESGGSGPSEYVVEEPEETPFDFVFEPDHYQSGHRHSEHCKVHAADTMSTCSSLSSTSNGAARMEEEVPTNTNTTERSVKTGGKRKLDDSTSTEQQRGQSQKAATATSSSYPVNRIARFKDEKDGILEYEYLSHRYTKPAPSQQINLDEQSTDTDHLNFDYYNEFDIKHHHLNAVIRGVSLVKWPDVGFGFSMTKSTDQRYYYVNEIKANSPAEFSLQVGDIILEIDELCPGKDFKSLEEIFDHLNRAEFIHLLVIHESKYFNLNLAPSRSANANGNDTSSRCFYEEFDELLKNFCINCQDIVVVSWPKERKPVTTADQ